MERRSSDSFAPRRNRALKGVGIFSVGKSAENAETQQYQEASAEWIENVSRLPRKSPKHIVMVPVPQTDTGSQEAYSKVLE